MDSRGAGCGQVGVCGGVVPVLDDVSTGVGASGVVGVVAFEEAVMLMSWSNLLRANGTGSSGLILRSLFLLKFSLFLRKSGNSKLISVPRWSSSRER